MVMGHLITLVGKHTFDDAKEGVLVGKENLESMLDKSGFGAATEMVGFPLDKGPEVSFSLESFCKSIFTSSALFRAVYK